MKLIYAPAQPASHRAIVDAIVGSDYDAAANDNQKLITGAKTHSWPAMRLNVGEGCEDNRRCLVLLSHLFSLTDAPAESVPSPAGAYGTDGELALSTLMDEVEPADDGSPGDSGYGIDFRMREGTDLVMLVEAGAFETQATVLPDGRKGAERTPNFRIIHAWKTQLIDGKVVLVTFSSYAEYRLEHEWKKVRGKRRKVKGKWRRVRSERFTEPRGPDDGADNQYAESATSVHPSAYVGATASLVPVEERLAAKQLLERLHQKIGDDAFDVLRMAVVERLTARQIGEAMGRKYNAASAFGTRLIGEALLAANDNLPSDLMAENAA